MDLKPIWDRFERGDHLTDSEARLLIHQAHEGHEYLAARGETLAASKTAQDVARLKNRLRHPEAGFRMDLGPRNAKEARVYKREGLLVDVQHEMHRALLREGKSRADLAELAGMTDASVEWLFAEDARPTLRFVARLAHAIGCTVLVSIVSDDCECPVCGGRRSKSECPAKADWAAPHESEDR
jgi:Helix-turn-helix domain